MLTIGLTGGIGSGKTAASDHFQKLGVHVVDADIVSREVVEPGKSALEQIASHFGSSILTDSGELDRAKLRHIIFNQPNEKTWLESLLHPIIRKEIKRQLTNTKSPYSILVSPLLFETNQHELVQRIILIDIPETLQLERASSRDKSTKEEIKKIVDAQAPRSYKLSQADDVIQNDRSLKELYLAVERQHEIYMELCDAQKT